MNKTAKIYVAGHRGMVGSGITRLLKSRGYNNVITRTHSELDLLNQASVHSFLATEKPDYIFIAAAKVGGIQANNIYRADFIYQNLMIECNLTHGAYQAGINNLMSLGSSCIYPRDCPQPIKEEYLLTGPLEQTNEPYALAKIAGIKLCENYNRQYGTKYVSVMPTNLYGPGDNYDLNNSHVLPALIRKAHEAKLRKDPHLMVWGSGKPRREFLHVDDMARACVQLMEQGYDGSFVNIGCGNDITIRELVEEVVAVVGFEGQLQFDTSKPDGTPQKLLDVSKANALGWKAEIALRPGIQDAYSWFLEHVAPTLK
ncbi:GDP-L-fucose synthase [Polynucleobacter sp. AP-Melu-500A-A1]|uniref:GDP-L-fucose synthase family protein n=1 Tax=Polynucleobacter sp. AP-Melu-500A-A1 TaxID=2576929 RepID=UPI001C0B40C8|nr:GDP-L-fucose synthase [Polynucleobacter sp. AP-Melu-500A-A1]MBU3629969.1 GDP-L-fucose synthase [Polynucleobacter sp. AP-Melu-500A-A1]